MDDIIASIISHRSIAVILVLAFVGFNLFFWLRSRREARDDYVPPPSPQKMDILGMSGVKERRSLLRSKDTGQRRRRRR